MFFLISNLYTAYENVDHIIGFIKHNFCFSSFFTDVHAIMARSFAYICLSVCMFVCIHVFLLASLYVSVCLSVSVCVCLSVFLSLPLSVCLCVCMFVCVHVCQCVYVPVCVCVSIYICTFVYALDSNVTCIYIQMYLSYN